MSIDLPRSGWAPLLLGSAALLASACGPSRVDGGHPLTPFGYERVLLAVGGDDVDPEAVSAVSVGGVPAFDLDATSPELWDGELAFVVQGTPTAGEHDVVLTLDDGAEVTLEGAVRVREPFADVGTLVTFGASYTQGVQSGVPTLHGGMHGGGAMIARRLGVYHPLPLVTEGLFREMTPEDITPAPECTYPFLNDFFLATFEDVAAQLFDDEGNVDTGLGRVTPELSPYNLAVGGSKIRNIYTGQFGTVENVLARLVLQPEGSPFEMVDEILLDRIRALEPDVLISADLLGNDVIPAVISTRYLDIERNRPVSDLVIDLEPLVDELAATGAEVFLANTPTPTILPAVTDRVREMRADGVPEEEIRAQLEAIDAMVLDLNDELARIAGGYRNVHVVDAYTATQELHAHGLDLGPYHLTTRKFGGLLSHDGLHFSDTGYAVLGDLILEDVQEVLDLDLPDRNWARVLRDDPYGLPALEDAGFSPDMCESGY